MAVISRTLATLRISGEDLRPEEITNILGCSPTYDQVKGQTFVGNKSGLKRVARNGMWSLSATDREPGDLDGQISEILESLNPDLNLWIELADNYELGFFCGLFMKDWIEGLNLSAQSLTELGKRNIELCLDIYGPDEK